jgi:hypothetical protein
MVFGCACRVDAWLLRMRVSTQPHDALGVQVDASAEVPYGGLVVLRRKSLVAQLLLLGSLYLRAACARSTAWLSAGRCA